MNAIARLSLLFGLTSQAASPNETSRYSLRILSCFVAVGPLHLPAGATYQTRARSSLVSSICLGVEPSQYLGRNVSQQVVRDDKQGR